MRTRGRVVGLLALGLALVVARAHGQTESGSPPETPEDVVGRLYELVTFEAGHTPDWAEVRGLFLDEAIIVLRTSRNALSALSVDGFVADFEAFIERANVAETGFSETVVTMRSMLFGDIAHILVLYEASIPGSARGPQQGLDSFQLIRSEMPPGPAAPQAEEP